MQSIPRVMTVLVGLAAVCAQPALAQTCRDDIEATAPDSRYTIDNGTQGTVTDDRTGLTWKRCSEGQTWDGATCTGSVNEYTWQEALQRAQTVNEGSEGNNLGHSDWRLPNKNELASLVERACYGPAINATIFPVTDASDYWSASPVAGHSGYAWFVYFDDGYVDGLGYKDDAPGVRLVRGGQ